MNDKPLVSIQIVVRNGERFIRHCLDAVRAQNYDAREVVILDNASTDDTAAVISREYPECRLIRHDTNLGMWPGQELLLQHTRGTYVLALSVDVIIAPDFVRHAVHACQRDPAVGAVQGKFYQYDIAVLENGGRDALRRDILDTCGFALTRSRKVLNVGHGQPDSDSFQGTHEIFGVEGAAPFFRRTSLEECRVDGMLWDRDYFWYGDDLDMAWRMHLFGHRQVFVSDVVGWHDRSTTKGVASDLSGHLKRRSLRRRVPLAKRRLDWSNVRFTIIKNDSIMNILRDFPWILGREIATFTYTILFEPGVLAETGRFLRLLPRMLRQRQHLMARAVTPATQMHRWFL